jgi:hypothetical protein
VTFAERYGFRPARAEVQLDGIDDDTRTALWNEFHTFFLPNDDIVLVPSSHYGSWVRTIWLDFFKVRVDRLPTFSSEAIARFSRLVFEGAWYDVYSLLEIAARAWWHAPTAQDFRLNVNAVLTAHLCGYRFVGADVMRLTDEEQIGAITSAQQDAGAVPPAREHLAKAASLLNDRVNPDYANSIKESIAAVEATARFVTGKPTATLGDALKKIGGLHPALRDGWLKLYGYTSDAGGIRHAAKDEIAGDADHALYFLVTCSAFVSLLLATVQAPG